MVTSKTRWFAVGCVAAMMLFATATPSQAGPFDWLCPSSWSHAGGGQPAPSATTFAPSYSTQRISWMPVAGTAAGCDPCGQQTNYAAETKYRWRYSRIPKTSMQAVSSCDPATGVATTVYKPITTYSVLPWLHREPYTAYRPVLVGAPAFNSYEVNRFYPSRGATSTFAPVGSDCSTCSFSSFEPTSGLSGNYPAPTISDPGYPAGRTYAPSNSGNSTSESLDTGATPHGVKREEAENKLQPIQDPMISHPTSGSAPKLITPRGRTAALPIPSVARVHPVAHYRPVERKLDVGGWRAVTD